MQATGNKGPARTPKSGGGILPYKKDHGQIMVLVGREHKKGLKPKHGAWQEFGQRAENPRDSDRKTAALKGFEEETGISVKDVEIDGKSLEDYVRSEGAVVFGSDIDNYSIFPIDVSPEHTKGFPPVSKLKRDLKGRIRAYQRAKLEGAPQEAARLRPTVAKDDFRWIPLDLLKRLAQFDATYYDEDLRIVSDWSGESLTMSKDFLNLLKENNTWGKPFLTFGQKA